MSTQMKLLARNTRFQVALGVVIFIIVVGIIGPYFVMDPNDYTGGMYEPPSWSHKLGTDSFGCDVWAELIYGIRNSLIVGSIAGLIGLVIAFVIGGLGGYIGGLFDDGLNLMSNIFLTLPLIPLLIILSALFEYRSLYLVAAIISCVIWPGTARALRSQVLSLKGRNFVDLALISGKSASSILFREIFPNMLAYIFISFCSIIGGAIVAEAGISLIGLGPTTTVTLGLMLHWPIMNQAIHMGIWWWFVPPGIIIMLISGSVITIGSVIDDALNPKLRGVL